MVKSLFDFTRQQYQSLNKTYPKRTPTRKEMYQIKQYHLIYKPISIWLENYCDVKYEKITDCTDIKKCTEATAKVANLRQQAFEVSQDLQDRGHLAQIFGRVNYFQDWKSLLQDHCNQTPDGSIKFDQRKYFK